MMPRFGTELLVWPGLEELTWYGRGPIETMIDREFERVGVYQHTVDQDWVEICGHKTMPTTGVRWVALTNPHGVGLLAVGAQLST